MPDATPKQPVVGLMPGRRAQIETLTRVCMDDLLGAFGLGGLHRGRHPLELFFRIPVRRLVYQLATYDEIVGQSGLGAGGDWGLERMARRVEIEGQGRGPRDGPLLPVSN